LLICISYTADCTMPDYYVLINKMIDLRSASHNVGLLISLMVLNRLD